MKNDLRNREQRLRYQAKKRGLYIQKGKQYICYAGNKVADGVGYCIGRLSTGKLFCGYNAWNQNLLTIEETEEIIENYQ